MTPEDGARRNRLAASGIRSTLIGVAANALLAGIKFAAGMLGNSWALVADAIESSADIAQSLIVYAGLRVAAVPPDRDHPYGHGKAEPLAATAMALGLFAAAATIAIQSVREILTPHHTPALFTLPVLVLVIAAKEALHRYSMRVGEVTGSTAVKSDAWHHRSDSLTSAAAFVGISIALVGGPGWEPADDWAALAACALIVWNAAALLRKSVAELMDEAPSPQLEEGIRRIAGSVDGVVGLEKCFVRKMGFDYFVDLHVLVDGAATVRRGHEIAHQVKDALRRADPRITDVLIHIEPPDRA